MFVFVRESEYGLFILWIYRWRSFCISSKTCIHPRSGGHTGGNQSLFLFHLLRPPSLFHSLSPFLSLSQINKHVLEWGSKNNNNEIKPFLGSSLGFVRNYFLRTPPCSGVPSPSVIITELCGSASYSWYEQKTEWCDFSVMVKPHFVRTYVTYSTEVWE